MITLLRLMLQGAYRNIARILAKADRATSIEIRNKVLNLSVPAWETVLDEMCIGCGACEKVCQTKAITMIKLDKPVEIIEGYKREKVPRIDLMKCVFCLNCHDFCPIFALFGEAAPIHARDVGSPRLTLNEILKKPIKAPPEKIEELKKLIPSEFFKSIRR
ncbi:MAG: 4Fe-4S binding protein [Candidatus Methanomethylicia archaeon]|nr:4Fe-4S binding protein [Candidatus Methanomethylicia archaeon]